MKYFDLRPAVEAYRSGRNVTETLRTLTNSLSNTPEIIEIAYDLQAGSYVEKVRDQPEQWKAYTGEIARILAPHTRGASTILDAGTGELTSLVGVAPAAYPSDAAAYACDISWSRLKAGLAFARESLGERQLNVFVANLFTLPLASCSMDVVWTSHALEPNGGKEEALLRELFRVTRRVLVLFEPSYERNSEEGRARMDALGYVRGLPDTIEALGGTLLQEIALDNVGNPLNPTVALVVRPPQPSTSQRHESAWACPATRLPMEVRRGHLFCEASRLAYPFLDGIPILRPEAAILASWMD